MPRTRPPFPADVRPLGQADQHQQRRDARQHPLDRHARRRGVRRARHREEPRHQGLLAGRQDRQRRPGRGPDGLDAATPDLRRRRRRARTAASSRPCSSAVPPAAASRRACSTRRVDYESLAKTGAIVGSGGMVVVDDQTCMVDLARFFLQFTQNESCGKCVPCRLGTKRMLEVLDRIIAGDGREDDIELLEELAHYILEGSLCAPRRHGPQPGAHDDQVLPRRVRGARQRAPLPGRQVQGADHLLDRRRQVHGLHALRQEVSGRAASAARRSSCTSIDQAACIKCDTCRQVCKFDAVVVRSGVEQAATATEEA